MLLGGNQMKWLFGKRARNKPPMTIEDGLSAVVTAANESLAAADALESTTIDSLHKASLIAQYEPNRFENDDAEYSEARSARDAAVATQDAANRLKEAALTLAISLKGSGYDLSAAEFAEVGSKALKIEWSSIHEKAAALHGVASQAQSAIREYYAD